MTDVLTPEQRRRCMSAIRSVDTEPELAVRSIAHRLGYRFRLHRKDLPGTPDLVFPSRRKVVEVRGCFWHQHPRCRFATRPSTRADFWAEKFAQNKKRDARNLRQLRKLGWQTLVIWECQTKDKTFVAESLCRFLDE